MTAAIYKVEGAVQARPLDPIKAGYGSPFPMSSSPTEGVKDDIIESNDTRMRQRWNKTKCAELGVPDHYTSIAVLIIHWAIELDEDLNCWEEV